MIDTGFLIDCPTDEAVIQEQSHARWIKEIGTVIRTRAA